MFGEYKIYEMTIHQLSTDFLLQNTSTKISQLAVINKAVHHLRQDKNGQIEMDMMTTMNKKEEEIPMEHTIHIPPREMMKVLLDMYTDLTAAEGWEAAWLVTAEAWDMEGALQRLCLAHKAAETAAGRMVPAEWRAFHVSGEFHLKWRGYVLHTMSLQGAEGQHAEVRSYAIESGHNAFTVELPSDGGMEEVVEAITLKALVEKLQEERGWTPYMPMKDKSAETKAAVAAARKQAEEEEEERRVAISRALEFEKIKKEAYAQAMDEVMMEAVAMVEEAKEMARAEMMEEMMAPAQKRKKANK